MLPTKSETGMWCKKVEFELDSSSLWLRGLYLKRNGRGSASNTGNIRPGFSLGDALLIDLRGTEPTFVSVPADYKPPEVVT